MKKSIENYNSIKLTRRGVNNDGICSATSAKSKSTLFENISKTTSSLSSTLSTEKCTSSSTINGPTAIKRPLIFKSKASSKAINNIVENPFDSMPSSSSSSSSSTCSTSSTSSNIVSNKFRLKRCSDEDEFDDHDLFPKQPTMQQALVQTVASKTEVASKTSNGSKKFKLKSASSPSSTNSSLNKSTSGESDITMTTNTTSLNDSPSPNTRTRSAFNGSKNKTSPIQPLVIEHYNFYKSF